MNTFRYVWKYFCKFCFKIVFRRQGNDTNAILKGWTITAKFCPLMFIHVRWNAESYNPYGTFEKSIFVSLFPGFPKPSGTVKSTFSHVFQRTTVVQSAK